MTRFVPGFPHPSVYICRRAAEKKLVVAYSIKKDRKKKKKTKKEKRKRRGEGPDLVECLRGAGGPDFPTLPENSINFPQTVRARALQNAVSNFRSFPLSLRLRARD